MDAQTADVIALLSLYAAWVLLPLAPAVLIYRLFPNTNVAVSGPLANLTVRASGAFAGYLIVFAASYSLVQNLEDKFANFEHEAWTVNARVKLINARGVEVNSTDLLRKIEVHPNPNPYTVESTLLNLQVVEVSEGQFPFMRIEIPEFGYAVVDLNQLMNTVSVDRRHKRIEIPGAIEVREEAATPALSQAGQLRPAILSATAAPRPALIP